MEDARHGEHDAAHPLNPDQTPAPAQPAPDALRAAADAVCQAWIADVAGEETFDPNLIDALGDALYGKPEDPEACTVCGKVDCVRHCVQPAPDTLRADYPDPEKYTEEYLAGWHARDHLAHLAQPAPDALPEPLHGEIERLLIGMVRTSYPMDRTQYERGWNEALHAARKKVADLMRSPK